MLIEETGLVLAEINRNTLVLSEIPDQENISIPFLVDKHSALLPEQTEIRCRAHKGVYFLTVLI